VGEDLVCGESGFAGGDAGCWGEVGDHGQAGFGGLLEFGVDVGCPGGPDALPGVEGLLAGARLDQGEELGEGEPELVAEVELGVARVGEHGDESVEEVGVWLFGWLWIGRLGVGVRLGSDGCVGDHAGIVARRGGGTRGEWCITEK